MALDGSSFPPTPSRFVRYPLRIVKSLQKGANLAPAAWYEIVLKRRDFRELRGRIRADPPLYEFVESNVRYDYSADTNVLVFRRPNPFHASLLSKLLAEIESILLIISQPNTSVGTFTRLLRVDVTPALYLVGSEDDDGPPFSRRHPDAAFWHADARWPGVVVEITHGDRRSGKRRRMAALARDYILKTDGDIRVVVSLEVDAESAVGSISIWRAIVAYNGDGWSALKSVLVTEGAIFRDEYGQPSSIPGAGLQLFLKDFACSTLTSDLPDDLLLIDAATLTRILHEAEEEEFERVDQLEGRLNYPRNLGSPPPADDLVPSTLSERRRRRRSGPNSDDEDQSLSEDSTQRSLKVSADESRDGLGHGEGHA